VRRLREATTRSELFSNFRGDCQWHEGSDFRQLPHDLFAELSRMWLSKVR
jgi:hypothetical protein